MHIHAPKTQLGDSFWGLLLALGDEDQTTTVALYSTQQNVSVGFSISLSQMWSDV